MEANMAEQADYLFAVKEHADGTPWIMLEPRGKQLPVLAAGFLGFDLRPGTSYEQAREVAACLNEHIETVSFTDLSNARRRE